MTADIEEKEEIVKFVEKDEDLLGSSSEHEAEPEKEEVEEEGDAAEAKVEEEAAAEVNIEENAATDAKVEADEEEDVPTEAKVEAAEEEDVPTDAKVEADEEEAATDAKVEADKEDAVLKDLGPVEADITEIAEPAAAEISADIITQTPESPEPTPVDETDVEPAQTELPAETTIQTPETSKPAPVVEEKKFEEETKEQTRLKKLEEARKKIERLKNKKNINNQQSKESTPIVEDASNKPDTTEFNSTNGNDKLIELNKIITNLNNTIRDKDAEILKLKNELNKEKQLNKDLQLQAQNTNTGGSSPLTISYEPVDFNKWKNYTIDMSEWRSIGSGPIVQF
ncbi:hypothetical protein AWRI3580_g1898 [Hanseniaspora uvarum]|uniref:Uncharacterized protein n=1 Tax=Hanseniaspora uvarum TaxID=29833 RepID=A0A1E5RPF0_HANUV|nr:hypothetical protein AWRI3580_g1898 [Hanseniaspora uvarum]